MVFSPKTFLYFQFSVLDLCILHILSVIFFCKFLIFLTWRIIFLYICMRVSSLFAHICSLGESVYILHSFTYKLFVPYS